MRNHVCVHTWTTMHRDARDHIFAVHFTSFIMATSTSQELFFRIVFTFRRTSSNNNETIVLANEPNNFLYISYVNRQQRR